MNPFPLTTGSARKRGYYGNAPFYCYLPKLFILPSSHHKMHWHWYLNRTSPELAERPNVYGRKNDIWCLGIIFLEMVWGPDITTNFESIEQFLDSCTYFFLISNQPIKTLPFGLPDFHFPFPSATSEPQQKTISPIRCVVWYSRCLKRIPKKG